MALGKDEILEQVGILEEVTIGGRAWEIYKALLLAAHAEGLTRNDLSPIANHPDVARRLVRTLKPNPAPSAAPTQARETVVTIPDKSVPRLLSWIRRTCGRRGIKTDFLKTEPKKWKKLLAEARGKTFEVVTHDFGRWWHPLNDGRPFQKKCGLDGNPVAFLFWVLKNDPMGYFGTVPNDDDLLFPDDVSRCAPYFFRVESLRGFLLSDVRDGWGDGRVLVAFRAMAPSEPVASA